MPLLLTLLGFLHTVWGVAAVVFLLNLPFGLWRAGVRKFSRAWFLSIHLPIPAVVALRLWSHIGFHWTSYPILVGAYFAGQLAGGRLRPKEPAPPVTG